MINIDVEIEKLREEVKDSDDYIVCAKSAGTIVTICSVDMGILKPSKCVFVGMPLSLDDADSKEYIDKLQNFNVPTLVIQKTNDPIASFQTVSEVVKNIPNIKLVEIEGDNHKYDDFELINKLAKDFY